MRILLIFTLLFFCTPTYASQLQNKIFDQETIDTLTAKTSFQFYKSVHEDKIFTFVDPNGKYTAKSQHWTPMQSKFIHNGRVGFFNFLEKEKDISMSQALDDLIQKTGTIDCTCLVHIVSLLCLQDIFKDCGKTKYFDHFCNQIETKTEYGFRIGGDSKSMDYLSHYFMESKESISIGNFYYMTNVKEYTSRHLCGPYTGTNLVVTGENQKTGNLEFYGFEPEFSNGPLEKEKIEEILFSKYKDNPTQKELEVIKKSNNPEIPKPMKRHEWEKKRKQYQKELKQPPRRFSAEKLNSLCKKK